MIKKSIIQRNLKKIKLIKKYKNKRLLLLQLINNSKNNEEKFLNIKKLQKLPKNSILIRYKNRCWKTGRAKGYYRFFGLCRHILREFTHLGYIPGVHKSSW